MPFNMQDWSWFYQPNQGRVPTAPSGNSARGPGQAPQQAPFSGNPLASFGQSIFGNPNVMRSNPLGTHGPWGSDSILPEFFQSMGTVEAERLRSQGGVDVANAYAGAQRHTADQQLAGTQATAGSSRDVGLANADAQVRAAEAAANAQRMLAQANLQAAIEQATISGNTSRDVAGINTSSAERINQVARALAACSGLPVL
jgi:hypothetical protein